MTGIEVDAKAVLTKGKLFTKKRYHLELWVNGQPIGVTVQCRRRNVKKVAKVLVDNAETLLLTSGKYEEVITAAVAAARKLPAKGDKVNLTVTIGKYPVGTQGTVVRLDVNDDANSPENTFPVLFCPDGMPNAEIPLAIGEWK